MVESVFETITSITSKFVNKYTYQSDVAKTNGDLKRIPEALGSDVP
jgi:hypothetical protein